MGGPLVRWRHQTVIAGESLPVTRAQGNVLKQDLQANHWESLSACWHGSRWRALGVRGVGASCWPRACSTMNQKPGVAACGEKEGIWARQIPKQGAAVFLGCSQGGYGRSRGDRAAPPRPGRFNPHPSRDTVTDGGTGASLEPSGAQGIPAHGVRSAE